ncbi:TF-B3 domain-containing protein [Heracleum sosnowskyi]|uniref:TF-B3 domain-containing protein n=1 Tax=Heracleum sosnowskyi TaxID=360622 RepID=A0AAD8NAL8_9APIA|nr:TF-B3 domain-containing protein [Heracleum sosnowskyi]
MKGVTEANIYDVSPEFRIIFFDVHSSDRLKIPPTFKKKLEGVFTSEYLLESRGKTWPVTLKEVHDNLLYLDSGWPEFVKDSALVSGDFLVFSYIGNSKFHVGIWDKKGCRKKFPDAVANPRTKFCNTFQISLRPAYLRYVIIPREVGKLLNKHRKCTLKVANSWWVVNCTGHECDRPRFGAGLIQFYKDNKVKVGDIVTFQLISEHDNVFTVDFSRP